MIKFFRQIRQKLLNENKFSKYLIYAIGEIVLVVIGILIAIQLKTWKSTADDNTAVLKHLNGLYAELNQDYERINTLYKFYADKTNSIQLLLKSNNQKITLSNVELGKLFNSSLEFKKYSNKKSSYISLINSGLINRIDNENLINEIIKYYESPYLSWSTEIYGSMSESIDYNQSDFYNSQDGLVDLNINNSIPNWQLNNKDYQTDYAALMQSKWAINILTKFLKQSNFIFVNLDSYKKMNDHLRKEIENYKKKG